MGWLRLGLAPSARSLEPVVGWMGSTPLRVFCGATVSQYVPRRSGDPRAVHCRPELGNRLPRDRRGGSLLPVAGDDPPGSPRQFVARVPRASGPQSVNDIYS